MKGVNINQEFSKQNLFFEKRKFVRPTLMLVLQIDIIPNRHWEIQVGVPVAVSNFSYINFSHTDYSSLRQGKHGKNIFSVNLNWYSLNYCGAKDK